MVTVGGRHEPLGSHTTSRGKSHETRKPLLTAGDTSRFEFSEDAWTTVGLFALSMGRPNLFGQSFILQLAHTLDALLSFAPGVEAASTDLHYTAERREGELLLVPFLVLLDEEVSHSGRMLKIPTAFFRISFSSFRR